MKFLKDIFKKRPHKVKSFLINDKHHVVEAFQLGGVTYYQFDSAFDMPINRAMASTWIFEELRMRVDREYLEKHVRAMEILTNPKRGEGLNIGAIILLNRNLKERLELAPFPDHLFKLGSVSYFDETENPYAYDIKYNEQKIARWKASGEAEMLDFFSQRLIPDLLPSLKHYNIDAQTFLETMEQNNNRHLSHLAMLLSKEN
jgi:hypothetical protein